MCYLRKLTNEGTYHFFLAPPQGGTFKNNINTLPFTSNAIWTRLRVPMKSCLYIDQWGVIANASEINSRDYM